MKGQPRELVLSLLKRSAVFRDFFGKSQVTVILICRVHKICNVAQQLAAEATMSHGEVPIPSSSLCILLHTCTCPLQVLFEVCFERFRSTHDFFHVCLNRYIKSLSEGWALSEATLPRLYIGKLVGIEAAED